MLTAPHNVTIQIFIPYQYQPPKAYAFTEAIHTTENNAVVIQLYSKQIRSQRLHFHIPGRSFRSRRQTVSSVRRCLSKARHLLAVQLMVHVSRLETLSLIRKMVLSSTSHRRTTTVQTPLTFRSEMEWTRCLIQRRST